MKEVVTIPKEQYEALIEVFRHWSALYRAGVYNWKGYGEAMRDLRNEISQ